MAPKNATAKKLDTSGINPEPAFPHGYLGTPEGRGTLANPRQQETINLSQLPCPWCGNGYIIVPDMPLAKGQKLKTDPFCSACGKNIVGKTIAEVPMSEGGTAPDPHPQSLDGDNTDDSKLPHEDEPALTALEKAEKAGT